ncbi:methylated-DNA--[protein]-cysteine S-methyltransferase [Asanoa sp. WMMD1127]|uniref:methylated-DNA--[protein]-cysteine S-methyltransferase n=1 Tax=Asanoa sp. WMMD1127 TaxID=3016107 RepID=UPI002416814E|nr:methylated-DNA--[protein]-cysteine S-methyltransferase [Asanoa sp. WMMD1127]MDG4822150.1 methylated-DNA--[protein]-cysteine S-methyltransferase [Asanoa sp. WMMD1127]
MRWSVVDSPVGPLSLAADEAGLCGLRFGTVTEVEFAPPAGVLAVAATQLSAYFAGELTDFDLPLSVRRGSEFERAVWHRMTTIPYGETETYGEVAAAVGDPEAARAVGVACNRNPIAVVVPCHRIVGAGGKLVGFGGGLPAKRFLLDLEGGVAFRRAWGGT